MAVCTGFPKYVLGSLILLLTRKYVSEPIAFYAEKLFREIRKIEKLLFERRNLRTHMAVSRKY